MNVSAPELIPMTILGGYLGSGKTTRINDLLADPARAGAGIAVLVNDFGAVNVDAELLRSVSGDVLHLENGCICCAITDAMPTMLRQLRARAPEHVVLELSGVGLPGAARSWAGYPGFRLHTVAVCVDVTTILGRLADRWVGDVVREQILAADEVLLTRTDLVTAREVDEVRGALESLVPGKRLGGRDLAEVLAGPAAAEPDPVAAATVSPDAHAHHVTAIVRPTSPVDRTAVEAWIACRPAGVVRVKGTVPTPDGSHLLTQFAGGTLDLTPGTGPATGLVVVAVPGVDPDALARWQAELA